MNIFNKHIVKKSNKITALLLCINFVISPLLIAFPTNSCNGMCNIDSSVHTCTVTDSEMNCCKNEVSNVESCCSSENAFKTNSCALKKTFDSTTDSFIIEKTQLHLEIDSIEFDYINLVNEINSNNFDQQFKIVYEGPPIYLQVNHFII